jgi:hypothetical protein
MTDCAKSILDLFLISSKCFGDEMPRIKEWLLDEGFEEVLAL